MWNFDERWSSQAVVGAVERDPRDGIRQALARLGKLVLEEGALYGVRLVGEKPFRLWSAKLRQPTDAAERLICASGQDAFFLRPSSSSTLPVEDKFAIVWGAKHADCSPTLLAELLQRAQQVPGHRGLARSMIGIGLRSPWTAIKLARRSFAPNDQRFTDDNLELKDELHFVIEGCPPQSQVADGRRPLEDHEVESHPSTTKDGPRNGRLVGKLCKPTFWLALSLEWPYGVESGWRIQSSCAKTA